MPLVSIGLPVFNGEPFLRAAVEAILAQDFQDLELIIHNNASTDATESICEHFNRLDSRVRYYRNPRNVGASGNYNLAFEKSRGTYFKWAAHDDVCEPTFISKCVAALESNPSAVLAHPQVTVIDENGTFVRNLDNTLNTADPSPCTRFSVLTQASHIITEVFGLVRSDVLAQTRLIGPFPSADRILLAELALRGSFANVPERLFLHRDHGDRSHKVLKTAHERAAWFAPDSRVRFPTWRFFAECADVIHKAPIRNAEKRCCYRSLAQLALRRRNRLLSDCTYPARNLLRNGLRTSRDA
jgi:glycosyltransferase involved in cell wall biosynthesis